MTTSGVVLEIRILSFNLPVSREALEVEHWPACALDRTGHIVYVNSAWDRVAVSANGPLAAEVLGTR